MAEERKLYPKPVPDSLVAEFFAEENEALHAGLDALVLSSPLLTPALCPSAPTPTACPSPSSPSRRSLARASQIEAGVTEVLPKHMKQLHLGESDATFLRLLVSQLGLKIAIKSVRFRCC